MGKIIVLDENSINKIAAGEVIERPLSIVKELVENSIDAGASKITVEIKNGGITYIKITDDGKGIEPDDVELAFERHATGKIRSADDLPGVMTMGFRGEALSSIAAVSEVEMFTKTIDNDYGINIKIKGGSVSGIKQAGCPAGTSISVKNLFYNTPARFKFLKKDTTEAGYISDVMVRLALSSPHISFRFISNGATLIHTPGNNDLASTIYSLYGREISQNLIYAEYDDEKFHITGYVGNTAAARSSRTQQSLFVNNRYVRNKTVTAAIDEAYKTLVMKNKFAFCVLKINVNPHLIDVNVHPNKMEIKFSDEGDLFRSVYHAINNALAKNIVLPEISSINKKQDTVVPAVHQNMLTGDNLKTSADKNNSVETDTAKDNSFASMSDINLVTEFSPLAQNEPVNADIPLIVPEADTYKSYNSGNNNILNTLPYEKDITDKIQELTINDSGDEHGEVLGDVPRDLNFYEQLIKEGVIIGQAFLTYIIIQLGDQLILIDQHAAHERIRYEKLVLQYENARIHGQNLIAPEIIEVTSKEKHLIETYKEFINSLGFETEDFGQNTIMIRQVPLSETDCSPAGLFKEVLDKIEESGDRAKVQANEILYSIACKGAIKANKRLGDSEITELIKGLAGLKTAVTCPHGRPIVLKLAKNFIEKEFKRIV